MKEVRTRFAPSPTGYMHIGNLRTALYEYLIAKKYGGKFILRIEDTDQERYVEGAVDIIYNTLKLANLKHDEGPDVGGNYGPYVQSERKSIYKKYSENLINLGGAYRCFCSKERLTELKEKNEKAGILNKYDGCCRHLNEAEIQKNLENNIPYVVRQKMPTSGNTSFDDVVYGTITVENATLDDQILVKSNGLPTYNFANVVDDHLMEITHVVRGSEYLSSTPKYNLLYEAFGWSIPTYVHLPPVMKNSTEKLSKRNGDASFEDLLQKGYLVETVMNYIALLGWSPGNNKEVFSLKELEETFSIDGISKSPSIFDINKLNWLSGEYIRSMSLEEFHKKALPYYNGVILNPKIDLMKVSKLLQDRTEILGSISENVDFFDKLPEYDTALFVHKKMKTTLENSLLNLKIARGILSSVDESDFCDETLHDLLIAEVEKLQIKNGQMLWPIRTAITGKQFTPGGAIEVAAILGKAETLKRINTGIEKLQSAVGGC